MKLQVLSSTQGDIGEDLTSRQEGTTSYLMPYISGRLAFIFTGLPADYVVEESLAPLLAVAITDDSVDISGYPPVVDVLIASRRAFLSLAWSKIGVVGSLSIFDLQGDDEATAFIIADQKFWSDLEEKIEKHKR